MPGGRGSGEDSDLGGRGPGRSQILAGREERLYVDYIRQEDGSCHWTSPADGVAMLDEFFDAPHPDSTAVRVVMAMHRIGLLTATGLQAIRAVWDGVTVDDTMRWTELDRLNVAVIEGLRLPATEDNRRDTRVVREHWTFPLHTLDLSEEKVDAAEVRRFRARRLALESGLY